jgi:prevent-host-death family protein
MPSDAAAQFNIHDAKTNLSRIIERVEHGEEIIISRAGHPVAKVVPLAARVHRTGRGSLRGRLVTTDDWDSDEVNEAIASDFGMPS